MLSYYLTGGLGLTLASVGAHVTLIWPPTGVALFALLAWGRPMWPALWLGSFLVNLHVGFPPALAMVIACGNTLGPVLAAEALKRTGFDGRFSRARDVVLYVAFGALAGMAITASCGTAALLAFGVQPAGQAWTVWSTWWLGDALGAVLVGPALLTLYRPAADDTRLGARFEPIVAWNGLLVAGLFSLSPLSPFGTGLPPLFALPFLLWLALRFDARHATGAALLLAVLTLWGVFVQRGPFVDTDGTAQLLRVWAYLLTLGIASLLITALRSESTRALAETRASEARYRTLVENLPGAVFRSTADRRQKPIYLSDGIEAISGLPASAFTSGERTLAELVHPDDAVADELAASLTRRAPYVIEYRLTDASGREHWILERGRASSASPGEACWIDGVMFDISERKAVEAELAGHRQHLEQLVAARPRH